MLPLSLTQSTHYAHAHTKLHWMHHAGSKYTHFFSLCLSIHLCISLLLTFFCWPTPERAHTHFENNNWKNEEFISYTKQSKRTEYKNYYGKINRFLIREKYNFNGEANEKKTASSINVNANTHTQDMHAILHKIRWNLICKKIW